MTRALTLPLALALSTSVLAQQPPALANLGVPVEVSNINVMPLSASNSILVSFASEAAQGIDLNGDGDLVDRVPQATVVRTGVTRNLGHAVPALDNVALVDDRHVAIYVDEARDGGTDHDGSGTIAGQVVFVHDTYTGATTNLAIRSGLAKMRDGFVLAAVYEHGGVDLNGDGVISHVAVLHDLRTHASTVLPGASSADHPLELGADAAVWSVDEPAGTDLNGDGDFDDFVVFHRDLATGVDTNLAIAAAVHAHAATDEMIAFVTDEPAQGGSDLDGDGDALDRLGCIVRRGSTVVQVLPVDTMPFGPPLAKAAVLAFSVQEKVEGLDLNTDGDTSDDVVHVYDARTGALTNLGLATRSAFPAGLAPIAVERDLVVFTVAETFQGGADRNGDGDATDDVLHAFDLRTSATFDSGLAIGLIAWQAPAAFRMSRGVVGALVSELTQGADLDGDGLLTSLVPHVWSPLTGVTTNLGVGASSEYPVALAFDRGRMTICAREGSVDSNGDGDTNDVVVRTIDTATSTVFDTGLVVRNPPMTSLSPFVDGRGFFAFAADELASHHGSLNGDADVADAVVHVVRTAP